MSTRYIGNTTHEKVRALNSIDVIFADSSIVRTAWKNLYDIYAQGNITADKQHDGMLLLLEAMAKELNYKDKIRWDSIKNVYLPTGLYNEMQSENMYKAQQLELLAGINKNIQQSNQQSNVQEFAEANK